MVDGRPEIVLLRHGESEWSRSGRFAGRADLPLTARGRHEMEALGPVLRDRWTFGRTLASPLQRARDSCRLAGFETAVHVRPDLIEWDYGSYEGRTTAEIAGERRGWSRWIDGAPEGETAAMVAARVDRVAAELREGPDTVIFAHRDVLRILAARWLGLEPEDGRLFTLSTASISVLGHEGDTPAMLSWNETAHLRGATAPAR